MTTALETKIPYTTSNIERCMCPQCPVQAHSVCVQEKSSILKNEVESSGKGEAPDPQKVPGVYCSTGAAICVDLDPNRECICKTCAVWAEYGLENETPMMYFCNINKAD